jgi:hypothetical protein
VATRSHVKQQGTAERNAMIANFKKVLADFDAYVRG